MLIAADDLVSALDAEAALYVDIPDRLPADVQIIFDEVAAHNRIESRLLLSRNISWQLSMIRHTAIALCLRLGKADSKEIAAYFNKGVHSVYHSRQAFNDRYHTDRRFRNDFEILESKILAKLDALRKVPS